MVWTGLHTLTCQTLIPDRVEWDSDKILVVTIDIETQCENGFPDPENGRRRDAFYHHQEPIDKEDCGVGYW